MGRCLLFKTAPALSSPTVLTGASLVTFPRLSLHAASRVLERPLGFRCKFSMTDSPGFRCKVSVTDSPGFRCKVSVTDSPSVSLVWESRYATREARSVSYLFMAPRARPTSRRRSRHRTRFRSRARHTRCTRRCVMAGAVSAAPGRASRRLGAWAGSTDGGLGVAGECV